MSSTGLELHRHRGGAPERSAEFSTLNRLLSPLSVAALIALIVGVETSSGTAFDFRYAYWLAGHRVLNGQSPWIWTHAQFLERVAFVYPALSAVMFAPISELPRNFGAALFVVVCVALVPATLWMLRIRDLRIYAVTVLWLPVYFAWQTANETLFLAFGFACLWRWRQRPLVAGLLTAVILSLKPLLWPLILWLVATRRWRASAWALVWGLALNLAAWSIVGFGQITTYLHAAASDTSGSWKAGFGIPALLSHFGVGLGSGVVVMLVTSALLAGSLLYVGLAHRDELRVLTLVVGLGLVSSPLLWSHYVTLMIVPLALLRRRFDWVWTLPLLLWIVPLGWTVHLWQWIFVWSVVVSMFVALLRQSGPMFDGPQSSALMPPTTAALQSAGDAA